MTTRRMKDLSLSEQEVIVLINGRTFPLEGCPAVAVIAVVRDAQLLNAAHVGRITVNFTVSKANVELGLSRPPVRFKAATRTHGAGET